MGFTREIPQYSSDKGILWNEILFLSMKISIITAVCNNRKEIVHAIDSVLSQSYPNIEYIVVDGASTDGTKEVIESYGSKISKFISEVDNGMYYALNKGISVATGDVIGILHSDDIFENNQVIAQIAEIFQNTGSDGIYGNLVYVNKKNPKKIIRFWKSNPFELPMLKKGWMLPHPTLFIKRNLFEKHGLYDTNYRISADYDLMLRMLSNPELKFAYLPQVITRMRIGGASNRSLKNIILKSKEDFRALQKNQIGGWKTLLMKNFSKIGQFF
jgi:glycosyltransferase